MGMNRRAADSTLASAASGRRQESDQQCSFEGVTRRAADYERPIALHTALDVPSSSPLSSSV